MKKLYFKFLISLILLAILVPLFFYLKSLEPKIDINKVCFSKNCFSVELAVTNSQREIGLMNRTNLAKDRGMLFVFNTEGNYPFWMKNTLISLDMIWLDKNYKVVFISKNAQPCRVVDCPIINPGVNAKYVLEINAGLTEEFKIKVNDYANITAQ